MAFDLFAIFHANLGFSSIPTQDYGIVLDRCFWPLVSSLRTERHLRLGLEFPGSTLEWIADNDQSFIDELRQLIDSGKAELVGSGLAQAILPIIPASVGAMNLELGNQAYERILGLRPTVAYSNEQTTSEGAARLYEGAGYEALVIDWENASQSANLPADSRWSMPRIAGSDLRILWSSTVMFQRVQRVAYGQMSPGDFLDSIRRLESAVTRPLCIYSNDWEVFDYHPGRSPGHPLLPTDGAVQVPRLLDLLSVLSDSGMGTFRLPSDVLARHSSTVGARIAGSAEPLTTKKQPKYNPARWALCGSTTSLVNTACAQLERRFAQARNVADAPDHPNLDALEGSLVLLHSSDLRTNLTQCKNDEMVRSIGSLASSLESIRRRQCDRIGPVEIAITNSAGGAWRGWPIHIDLHFKPGQFSNGVRLEAVGRGPFYQQIERAERYPDRSLRFARIAVAGIELAKMETVEFKAVDARAKSRELATSERAEVATPTVVARFNKSRGGSLSLARFPGIDAPAIGHVEYGQLSPTRLTPDWYTGNSVVIDESGRQITDLSATEVWAPRDANLWPIRVPIACRVRADGIEFVKTAWVSQMEPRIDLDIEMTMGNSEPRSLHAGIVSVIPDPGLAGHLRLATVNGGFEPDVYSLSETTVMQSANVSPRVSVSSCLGSTEGWAAILGPNGGLAVHIDKASLSGYPLLEYEPTPDGPFVRLVPSFAETADTGSPRFRGRLQIKVAYEGFAELDGRTTDDWRTRRTGVMVTGSLARN